RWQEVEHQVRVDHVVVAAGEAAALEVVGGPRAAAQEQPLRADHGAVAPLQRGRDRHRQLRAVLDVHLQVVLQVLAHAGQVGDHVDAERGQVRGGADAGQLEQLRGVDRPAGQDELAGPAPLGLALVPELDADGAGPVEDDFGNEGPGGDGEVRPAHHRIEVGPRGGQPPSAVDVPVERGEALLPVAVHVVGELVAGLLHGGEE